MFENVIWPHNSQILEFPHGKKIWGHPFPPHYAKFGGTKFENIKIPNKNIKIPNTKESDSTLPTAAWCNWGTNYES